jgi:hypothetical protein
MLMLLLCKALSTMLTSLLKKISLQIPPTPFHSPSHLAQVSHADFNYTVCHTTTDSSDWKPQQQQAPENESKIFIPYTYSLWNLIRSLVNITLFYGDDEAHAADGCGGGGVWFGEKFQF